MTEEEVEDAPQGLKDGGQSTVDELKEVNLGITEESCSTFISTSLSEKEEGEYAIKGQALADFLADHLVPLDWKLSEDLPDDEVLFTKLTGPWVMFFDGAARRTGAGVGIILISLEMHMLPDSFALVELCLNNVAEYQALIIGLQMALEIEVSYIEIFGDSKSIINQLLRQYDVKHDDSKPYFIYARQLMGKA
ncbi:uncharacterized protein LOC120072102 [Benincasa hispida]|uniref:uncharacterized protein LOC120072102 n=1 Tax=Benincasa hispida TaxID=102211 RepID=UPI00190020CD|nr:uncharacterized protein LOC120072102 [Benincasa hispida]